MIGANRQRVGDNIADNIQSTAAALAAQQSGQDLANLLGSDTNALINLINAAQAGDAASNEALAAILANIATQSGSQVAGRPSPGVRNDPGILETIGSVAGGVGTAASAMGAKVIRDLKQIYISSGSTTGTTFTRGSGTMKEKRLTGLDYGAGVMADEVIEIDPAAVSIKDGYLTVDYSRIF